MNTNLISDIAFNADWLKENPDPVPIEVVRVKRSYYSNSRGLHSTISIIRMKRLSTGLDFLNQDAKSIGNDLAILKITNLHESPDGLYIVTTCDESTDWESGELIDYNYVLIPYEQEERP